MTIYNFLGNLSFSPSKLSVADTTKVERRLNLFSIQVFSNRLYWKKKPFNILVYNSWPFLPMVYPPAYILGEVQLLN